MLTRSSQDIIASFLDNSLPSTLRRSEGLKGGALDGHELAVGVDRLNEVLVGSDVVTAKRST